MLEKVKLIIANQLGLEVTEIFEESVLSDELGADSLDLYSILMELENEFNMEIPVEEIEEVKTVKELIEYLSKKTEE